MKVVLFCGGLGSRLGDAAEGSSSRIPKPMAEVGGRPLLWHLLHYYDHFGFQEFVLCLGFGGDAIREYVPRLDESATSEIVRTGEVMEVRLRRRNGVVWVVTLVETGLGSCIGERLRRVRPHLAGEGIFLANYADVLADLDVASYVDAFRQREEIACCLSVRVPQTFHVVESDGDGRVLRLDPIGESAVRVNGGFFVLREEIFDHLGADEDLVEAPFRRLIAAGRLRSVPHAGFWHNMDTLKDKLLLSELAASPPAPWQVWLERGERS